MLCRGCSDRPGVNAGPLPAGFSGVLKLEGELMLEPKYQGITVSLALDADGLCTVAACVQLMHDMMAGKSCRHAADEEKRQELLTRLELVLLQVEHAKGDLELLANGIF